MHLLCPHCHNPIELADLHDSREIVCTACGSTFQLETGTTMPWRPAVGRRQLGRFELLNTVGVGAYGTVYRALDPELDRVVAIKVPRGGNLDGEDLDRFAREARSIAQLRHPGIVPVHEFGQSDGVPFLVTEFVPGRTLADQLQVRRLEFREAAELLADVADALHCAHERGIVHRDVKPSNILLDAEGKPHLTDFGLAKRDAGEITMTLDGQILGTPAYMAPEQARGESHAVDGRSDVYSLGVILYELLTGELPFRGNTRMLLHQVLHDEPRPPRSLNDRIPRDLETICLRCIQKNPSQRYPSACEFAADLRRFLSGESIQARPISRVEKLWRWAKLRPAVAALLATLVLVIVLGFNSLTVLWLRADRQRQFAEEAQATASAEAIRAADAAQAAEQRQEESRRYLYGTRATLMQVAWRERALGRVQELLNLQRPKENEADLRGFEWYYFARQLEGSQVTLAGHADIVTAMAFSPNRRHLASGSRDGTAKVWELATRLELRSFPGHAGGVTGLALSPNARRLAVVSGDGTVRIWDTTAGKELFSLGKRPAGPGSVAFSPDGRLLAVAGVPQATVHDETGKQVQSLGGQGKGVAAVTFNADGQRMATADSDGTVRIWETASNKELHQLRNRSPFRQLTFMADERHLSLTDAGGGLSVWQPESGRHGAVFPPGTATALSRDGRQLAYASDLGVARVLDPTNGREVFALRQHAAPITAIAFSADGGRIATASQDRTVKVWLAGVFELDVLELAGHVGEVFAVVFSPDGNHLSTGGADGTLRIREAATGQEILLIQAHAPIRQQLLAPDQAHHLQGTCSLAYRGDGRRIASGGADGQVKTWDTVSGKRLASIRAHAGPVSGVAFSPDGRWIASSSWDKTVKVWDAQTSKLLHTLSGHTLAATRVAFSPDGKFLASCSWDQTIRLWDPATGTAVRTIRWVSPRPGRVDPLDSLAFHPEGTHLAAAPDRYGGDGDVKVFDLATDAAVHSLGGHIYGVFQVVFSADGRRLASCSCDGGLKVWDMATGQELFSYHNYTGVPRGSEGRLDSRRDAIHSVAMSPDGRRLAMGCRNSHVLLLDASPPTPELLVEREAHRLIRNLYRRHVSRSAVMEQLAEANLSPALRQEATARATRFLQSANALNNDAWNVVHRSTASAAAYQRALLQAEEACRLSPEDGNSLNTLGVAQYRAGRYETAVKTLIRSDQLNSNQPQGPAPADLAFLAMSQHQLGRKDEARATLTRLRKAMTAKHWVKDEESQSFLQEAEALIQPDAGKSRK